jgi:hypothetical protein
VRRKTELPELFSIKAAGGCVKAWATFSRFQAAATVRLRTADFDSEQAEGVPRAAFQP